MLTYKIIETILKIPLVYYIWDRPFNQQKNRIIQKVLPQRKDISILDIGCGPGSNTEMFLSCQYTGIDLNSAYIDHAQKKFPNCQFFNQDATQMKLPAKSFDLVLINGFFHHIPDETINNIITESISVLKDQGRILIFDPIIPPTNNTLQNMLMKLDRGKFFRSETQLKELFDSTFETETKGLFPFKLFGLITGWQVMTLLLKRI